MEKENSEIVLQIWNESRNRLKGFISKRVSNETDAEDILQNIFIKIHEKINYLKDSDKLYGWVFQTTRNAIIDYYRGRKLHTALANEIPNEMAVEPDEKDFDEEVLGWLEQMIGELPEKYREALLLTDINGLTQKELAEKLDISLSGAKSRVQRGREHLRENIIRCCHLEFNRAGKIVEYRQKTENCRVCSN